MATIAIYPGSFDPVTYGHIDLVERATKLFDKIIVAVANNHDKKPLLSFKERIKLTTAVTKHLKQVQVVGLQGLLVDFAKKRNCATILRGVRAMADFEFELQLAHMNRTLMPTIETLFLMASEPYYHISSSLIKEIAATGKNVTQFVPRVVATVIATKYQKNAIKK